MHSFEVDHTAFWLEAKKIIEFHVRLEEISLLPGSFLLLSTVPQCYHTDKHTAEHRSPSNAALWVSAIVLIPQEKPSSNRKYRLSAVVNCTTAGERPWCDAGYVRIFVSFFSRHYFFPQNRAGTSSSTQFGAAPAVNNGEQSSNARTTEHSSHSNTGILNVNETRMNQMSSKRV